jgi:hypothetical protein
MGEQADQDEAMMGLRELIDAETSPPPPVAIHGENAASLKEAATIVHLEKALGGVTAQGLLVARLATALARTIEALKDAEVVILNREVISDDYANHAFEVVSKALALTPASVADCEVVPKGELAELRKDRERLKTRRLSPNDT